MWAEFRTEDRGRGGLSDTAAAERHAAGRWGRRGEGGNVGTEGERREWNMLVPGTPISGNATF